MSRAATGTVRLIGGIWHAKWTRADGTRSPWTPLPGDIPPEDKARAQAEAARLAPRVRAAPLDAGVVETVAQWFERLHNAKQAKGLATVKDMRGRARKWILPGIAEKDMAAVTREDVEAIVRRLDAAVAAFMKHGPGKGRLSPSTAGNVWGETVHAFDEAVCSKDPSLRVLEKSPCTNVKGPDAGDDRTGQILYSDELVALLVGESVIPGKPDVPLYRRQTYAMAVYTKARASELEALKPEDVDLARQTIDITKQADRTTKERRGTKKTKTKRQRTIDIEPNVRPLVEWLVKHPQGRGGRLLHMPPPEDRPELLRQDLHRVGVTRARLFIEGDAHERAIVFHDLRDTGLTHMAVRGDSPVAIQWQGGHSDYKTTQGYVDRGKVEARRIGAPLPPLPPGIVPESSRAIANSESLENPLAIQRPQRELNAQHEVHGLPAIQAESEIVSAGESSRESANAGQHRTALDSAANASDADLEAAIVRAVTMGLGDVAKTLAAQLEERRRARAGNVVDLARRRR